MFSFYKIVKVWKPLKQLEIMSSKSKLTLNNIEENIVGKWLIAPIEQSHFLLHIVLQKKLTPKTLDALTLSHF